MRVLVVLTQPPLPEGGAPGRCAVGLLRGLAEHGLELQAVAARRSFAVAGEPPPDLPVEVVDVPPSPPGLRTRAARLARPFSELAGGAFGARVRELAGRCDVIHLEETETAWCSLGARAPALVHMHYLVSLDRDPGPPWRPAFREVVALARAERAAVRRHRSLVASSPVVAAALHRRAPSAEITLAPLSLDPAFYPPAPLDGPPRAGVIGTASWPPTASAVQRLVRDVWPRVRLAVPEARLVLGGRGMDRLAGLADADGVEVLGEVPSAVDFLRGLSVLVYPLSRGSGMKVKVLEAIACGVPVVTTVRGAEGIDAGEGVVVEEQDAGIAAAAAALLRDADERRARGEAARAAFLARYAPGPATEPLIGAYRRLEV